MNFQLDEALEEAFLASLPDVEKIGLTNFKSILIPAECIEFSSEVDSFIEGECIGLENNKIWFLPSKNKLSKIMFQDVYFNDLELDYPAKIELLNLKPLRMRFYQGLGKFPFYFDEKLRFTLYQGVITDSSEMNVSNRTSGAIQSRSGELYLEGNPKSLIEFYWSEDSIIESLLKVSQLQFTEKLHTQEGGEISTILSGNIEFWEGKSRNLSKGTYLDFKVSHQNSLLIREMTIRENEINLLIEGNFNKILINNGKGKQSNIIPSRLEWLLFEHGAKMILGIGFLIGLSILLLIRKYKSRKKAILFLALANSPQAYLGGLKKERIAIEAALQKVHKYMDLLVVPDATIDDIFAKFKDKRYRERITIFHFAGHGIKGGLNFESIEGAEVEAKGEGLAKFLGQQQSLKLVFYNACISFTHQTYLKEAGVPNGILTNISIGDEAAVAFAKAFYENLAANLSAKQAFYQATQEVYTFGFEKVGRRLELDYKDEANISKQPWLGNFDEDNPFSIS